MAIRSELNMYSIFYLQEIASGDGEHCVMRLTERLARARRYIARSRLG